MIGGPAASGVTRTANAKASKPTTFDYWRPLILPGHADAKLANQASAGERETLVPVKVIDVPHADVVDVLMLKSPSGWEVRLPAQADPNWLIKVLRQLP